MARYNLGSQLLESGCIDPAITQLNIARSLNPHAPEIRNNLGNALSRKGLLEEALSEYAAAVRCRPDFPDAENNMGNALLRQGKVAEALVHFRKSLELQPGNRAFANNLAWILATGPEEQCRNGGEAVRLALEVNRCNGGHDPSTLRTLAAAFAEAGDYPMAVNMSRLALDVLGSPAGSPLGVALKQENELYRLGQPLHFRD